MFRFSPFFGLLQVCGLVLPALGFSGSVTRDSTWTTDMTITGNVTVRDGATLTINPHLTITFAGDYTLATESWPTSGNSLVADNCLFTATQHTPGFWEGILVNNGDSLRLQGCEICYANQGVAGSSTFAGSMTVTGCHVHDNHTGIYLNGGLALPGPKPNLDVFGYML